MMSLYAKVLLLIFSVRYTMTVNCPQETQLLRRLGDTRFYIVHANERGNYVSHDKADAECKKFGLKMAMITNMRTFAIVGRHLEKVVLANKLKDTWYWLPAEFDTNSNTYKWIDTKESLKFHNFLYRKPRPTGVGSMVNYRNIYEIERNDSQCISLSLPWFGPWESAPSYETKGNQFIVEERPCDSVQRRHVICESTDATCDSKVKGAFKLTEGVLSCLDKVDYFETGNWILGSRTFIVNWKMRTYEESKLHCEKLKMNLYEPFEQDDGLIPFLKMWTREITMSTFWTSMKWNRQEEYLFTNGTKVSGREWKDLFDEESGTVKREVTPGSSSLHGRSGKFDMSFCVAMGLAYEFNGQTPCSQEMLTDCKCQWHFREFTPSNCENYHGTICASREASRSLTWDPDNIDDIDLVLNKTATVPFAYPDNRQTLRSTYKQTFGSLVCPPGYHMLRMNNIKWSVKTTNVVYNYDYHESYWVVDQDYFQKDIVSNCTLSKPADRHGHDRKLESVPCGEWHFYLCQRKPTRPAMKFNGTLNLWYKMLWEEGPQERTYPIIKGDGLQGKVVNKAANDLYLRVQIE